MKASHRTLRYRRKRARAGFAGDSRVQGEDLFQASSLAEELLRTAVLRVPVARAIAISVTSARRHFAVRPQRLPPERVCRLTRRVNFHVATAPFVPMRV